MTEEEIKLKPLTYEQRKFIREKQSECGVCKCYGIENCDAHAKIFRNFTK